jgi:hypothetical protein
MKLVKPLILIASSLFGLAMVFSGEHEGTRVLMCLFCCGTFFASVTGDD